MNAQGLISRFPKQIRERHTIKLMKGHPDLIEIIDNKNDASRAVVSIDKIIDFHTVQDGDFRIRTPYCSIYLGQYGGIMTIII